MRGSVGAEQSTVAPATGRGPLTEADRAPSNGFVVLRPFRVELPLGTSALFNEVSSATEVQR